MWLSGSIVADSDIVMIINEFQPKYDVTRKMQKAAELARVI